MWELTFAKHAAERVDPLRSRPARLHARGEGCQPHYRDTSLVRNSAPLGPNSRTITRVLWWSWREGPVSYERGTPVHFVKRGGPCQPHPISYLTQCINLMVSESQLPHNIVKLLF